MTVLTPTGPGSTALVELRVLEGPNLYFPRAAVKLTLDVGGLAEAPEAVVRALAAELGMRTLRPGPAATGFRQRALLRVVTALLRRVAAAGGTTRLGVRVRPGLAAEQVVAAYPWRDRTRAVALGRGVVAVLDALAAGADVAQVEALVADAGRGLREVERGPGPTTLRPRVPVVAVTGTNGKTTTSRLVAHLARTAGHHVGWSSTDGVYVDGVLVEAGDYSGPSGAGRVLAEPGVDLAVVETARGGILLKGMGVAAVDVSVVTNVSADHLGLHGIDTLDQLAEVKGVVPRTTKPTGWAVLNADDPRVHAMRLTTKGRPWAFSRDPDSPALREVLAHGGRATTVIDGWVTVLDADGTDPLLPVAEVPMTLAGLSRPNVENALAAASAALAAGVDREHVVTGLRTFLPDAEHNPGRMNCFSWHGATVVVDLAHNEVGLEAMLEIMAGLRAPGARLLLALGAVGDRSDDLIEGLGEVGARGADVVAIGHKQKYLRTRTMAEVDALLRVGAARVGVSEVVSHPTELDALAALVEQARPGDVVGLMCHAERQQVYDWLAARGATPDGPDDLLAKVRSAHHQEVPS